VDDVFQSQQMRSHTHHQEKKPHHLCLQGPPINSSICQKWKVPGVIIAAKENICGTELDTESTSEIVAASFNGPNNSQLVICSTYRPPSSYLTYMENLCTGIKKLHTENKNATIWIAGDMNLPDIDWTLFCGMAKLP
jgi:hypothetical protein